MDAPASSTCRGDPTSERLRLVGRGDHEAFARLYDDLAARVFGVIVALVDDAAAAEDTLRDVFLEVWRTAARLDVARGSGETWILQLARRRALDRARAAVVSTRGDVSGSLDLSDLEVEQRRVLTLAYHGHRQTEIAEMTLLPLRTVRSLTRAALSTLQSDAVVRTP